MKVLTVPAVRQRLLKFCGQALSRKTLWVYLIVFLTKTQNINFCELLLVILDVLTLETDLNGFVIVRFP